jgi:predicted lipoprotein with Yx(FWY)xxD motif
MGKPRWFLRVAAVAIAAAVFGACAKSTTTANPGAGDASSPASTAATVEAKSVPGVGMVLVDSNGLTLYYLKGETASSIMCTGGCASAWPPLVVPAGTQPTAGSGVTGQLGTVSRPDGAGLQVTYEGSPLYTFASDSAGQASGQGVSGFFAMTPAGATGSTATSSGY